MDGRSHFLLQTVQSSEVLDQDSQVVALTHDYVAPSVGPDNDGQVANDSGLLLLLLLSTSLFDVHGAGVLGGLLESLLSLELGQLELDFAHLLLLLFHFVAHLGDPLIDEDLEELGELARLESLVLGGVELLAGLADDSVGDGVGSVVLEHAHAHQAELLPQVHLQHQQRLLSRRYQRCPIVKN